MMTPERLAEIQAIEKAATRGPWEACDLGGEWNVAAPDGDCIFYRMCGNLGMDDGYDAEDVAKFVTASRTIVPELLEEVKRLRAGIVALKESMQCACDEPWTKRGLHDGSICCPTEWHAEIDAILGGPIPADSKEGV